MSHPEREPYSITDAVRWFSSHSELRTPMTLVVGATQRYEPPVRILAPALTLICLCDAVGLDPMDVVRQMRRATKDVDGPFTHQYDAMVNYAKGEILRGD